MRIQTNNSIDFQLPADFEAELTRYNVLLSDVGEQTTPLTLPGTPHNMQLIGYSNRLDNYNKPISEMEVLVSDGLFVRPCNMALHTADENDGISVTLYLGTGDFYSRVGDKMLSALAWPVVKSTAQGLIDLLKTEFFHPTDTAIFCVAQIETTQEYVWRRERITGVTRHDEDITETRVDEEGYILRDEEGNVINFVIGTKTTYTPKKEWVNITEKLILNAFESEQPENVLPAHTMSDDMEACQVSLTTLQGEHKQKIVEDGAEITLPIGYGMTPFLKLRYVLETIFNGYTLDTSAIQLVCDVFENKMCLINNVADTICSGTLKFLQLIPEISIKEFIDRTEKMFAGKFIINEFTKTVTFNTYNEKLTIHADLDLSNYLVSTPKLGTPDFTTVVVKYKSDNVSSTNEAQTKTELLEFDFLNRINTKMSKLFKNSDGSAYYYVDLTLYLLQITDIIHKNTSVVIAGKTITEEQKASNLVQIMTIDSHTNSSFYYVVPPNVFGYPIFYTAMQYIDLHPDIDSFYSAYKSFRLNSNIPIEVEMNIPDQVLESLNFSTPKIVQGQKVMIESIVQKLGKKDIQKVKFRTLRSYQ